MTRKKVKLVWIVNDAARKASFKKRRVGLLKKVSELTTLCGVNAFVIIFNADDREPAMWPSRPVVEQLLGRFHSLPEIERCKKMMNQETYLKERVTKVQEQLKKHQRRNKEMDVSYLMHQLYEGKREDDDFNINELHGLFWFSEEKKKEIKKRIDYFRQVNAPPLPVAPLPPAAAEETAPKGGNTGGDGSNPAESLLWDQWLIDMMNNTENNNNNAAGESGSRVNSELGLSTSHHMGLPYGSINIGGSDGGGGGNEIGLGLLQPQENVNYGGNETGLELNSEIFGGAGSDMGLPFDVTKQWHNNFYP